MLTVGKGSALNVVDVPGKRKRATLRGHTSMIWNGALSPDGKTLATAGGDGTVKFWDTAALPPEEKPVFEEVSSVFDLSPDGRTLAAATLDAVKVRDLSTNQEGEPFRGHKGWGGLTYKYLSSVVFSPDGALMATSEANGMVALWEVASRKQVHRFPVGMGQAIALAFSPDGKTLVAGTNDLNNPRQPGLVQVWDVEGKRNVASLMGGGTGGVWHVAFSPDGRTVAARNFDTKVRLFDVVGRRQMAELTGLTNTPTLLTFSPDGKYLAAGASEGLVKVWEVATRKEVATLGASLQPVMSVAFSPDGKTIAGGCSDNKVRLWNTRTWRPTLTLSEYPATAYALTFTPDGNTLIAGLSDRTIRLWRAPPLAEGERQKPAPLATAINTGR
jgi:WD40 repeat protein